MHFTGQEQRIDRQYSNLSLDGQVKTCQVFGGSLLTSVNTLAAITKWLILDKQDQHYVPVITD